MLKRMISVLLAAVMCMALAACAGVPENVDAPDPVIDDTADDLVIDEATDAPAQDPAGEPTEEPAAEGPSGDFVAEEGGLYVNFDEMNFYVNGTKFTMGVSTLQDMIDAGVPFKESDLEDAETPLKATAYSINGFRIVLGEYYTATVYVMNATDEEKKACDCMIYQINYSLDNKQQDVLRFAFPLNLTEEELVANAGEPASKSHYDGDDGYYSDTYRYEKKAERFLGNNVYEFTFIKGALGRIRIEYLP